MKAGFDRGSLLTLAVVAWAGLVIVRYQPVASAEPIVALALALLFLGILTLASLATGLPILHCVAPRGLLGSERLLLGAVTGSGVLVGLAAALSLVGALRPAPLLVVILLAAALGARPARRELARIPFRLAAGLRTPALLIGLSGLVTLLVVLTPSPFYDQLHYQLAFPFHWLRAGHVSTFPRHTYSFLPANMGLLYCYALGTLGPWAAQAAHWWTGALAVAGTALVAGRLGGPRAAWWGAALLALTPSVLLVSTWAAADLGVTAFAIAAWLAVVIAWREVEPARRPVWWALVGALVGLACGCKLLALAVVAAPVGVAVLLAPGRSGWRRLTSQALPFALGTTLALAPWLVRSAVLTGNPVYPFLGSVFAAFQRQGVVLSQGIARVGSPLAEPARMTTLTTFAPGGDAGNIGPLFLALMPLAVWAAARRRKRGGVAVACGVAVGVLGWAVGPLLGRYLLPVLAPLAALEGVGVQLAWHRLSRGRRPLVAGGLAVVLSWNLVAAATPVELRRLAVTLGRADGSEILRELASYWPAVAFVNERLAPEARLLLVGESRSMYLDRDVDVEDPFAVPRLVELARNSRTPGEIAAKLRAEGITHVLVNWHEAGRIAALNGRDDYFAPLTPVERARLDAFLATQLEPLFEQWPVTVFALGPRR